MDDLWDFGTVRHVSKQSTIGRRGDTINTMSANGNGSTNVYGNAAINASPPRTRVAVSGSANGTPKGPRRTGSEISLSTSIASKGEKLPPLPLSASAIPESQSSKRPVSTASSSSGYSDMQATVRHAEPPAQSNVQLRLSTGSLPSSRAVDEEDEEEDYGELLSEITETPYPPMLPQHDRHMTELPDTAMLDSVVLPAIASVRTFFSVMLCK